MHATSHPPESRAPSPEERRRIEAQIDLAAQVRPHAGGPAYLGHMRLATDRRVTDVLLGTETRPGSTPPMIDWRTAPLAEVFFSVAEGDEYELEIEGRIVEGRLLERSLLGFEAGRVVEIITPHARLTRRGSEDWRREALPTTRLARPEDAAERRSRSAIEVVLDEAQLRAVRLPPRRPVLVLGEAGAGKTTVALHRLAHLRRENPRLKAAVVVPTDGLRRLVESLLERLGVEGVDIFLYDRFAARQARAVFPGLPRRESQDAAAAVLKVKRHPALSAALEILAARPSARRIRPAHRKSRCVHHEDLLHLFGDTALLDAIAAAAPQDIAQWALKDVLGHTKIQFAKTTEQSFSHVEASRLETVDGRTIDAGTPTQDAGTVDAEDYAVLFELDRLRARRLGVPLASPPAYDCIVLDEAQELAPLELALVGRSLAPGGTVIVAGDAEQQVDESAYFEGWAASMRHLGSTGYEEVVLEVGYRCPPQVTSLARHVLDAGSAVVGPAPGEPAASVFVESHESDLHLAVRLVDDLRTLRERDPGATVAIIARAPEVARRLAAALAWGLDVRLALDGDFVFQPGVVVTCVQEVKGLEFETVIVPDATGASYPDAPRSRRALYVALTRATHQLALTTVGRWTPLVPPVGG